MVHELTTLHEIMGAKLPTSVVAQGGIFHWNDGRTVPDTLTAVFEYSEGFDFTVHISQATAALGVGGMGDSFCIGGTQGTLVWGRRPETLQIVPEGGPGVPRGNIVAWPKEMQQQYFAAHGLTPQGKPQNPPQARNVETIRVEPSPASHEALFIQSVRSRTPSVETAEEGHNAAAAAHMANMSYLQGRRVVAREAIQHAKKGRRT
jgi:predicted dehydrogenase